MAPQGDGSGGRGVPGRRVWKPVPKSDTVPMSAHSEVKLVLAPPLKHLPAAFDVVEGHTVVRAAVSEAQLFAWRNALAEESGYAGDAPDERQALPPPPEETPEAKESRAV